MPLSFDSEYDLKSYIMKNFHDIDILEEYCFVLCELRLNGYGVPDLIFVRVDTMVKTIDFMHVELKNVTMHPKDFAQLLKQREGVKRLHKETLNRYGWENGSALSMLLTKNDEGHIPSECYCLDSVDGANWYTFDFDSGGSMVLDRISNMWSCLMPKNQKMLFEWCDKFVMGEE